MSSITIPLLVFIAVIFLSKCCLLFAYQIHFHCYLRTAIVLVVIVFTVAYNNNPTMSLCPVLVLIFLVLLIHCSDSP